MEHSIPSIAVLSIKKDFQKFFEITKKEKILLKGL